MSERTFKKCLERQVAEGVAIASSEADIIINSKAEFHQPALSYSNKRAPERGRVITAELLPNFQPLHFQNSFSYRKIRRPTSVILEKGSC